ncbi:hypothetical protein ASPWEDRAFT_697843 [Aspergillus wentii DTO 134E9]|uniref:Zn(2)-C6 fungal-type domain-containing protein n=1 Tax=Aspergillus wentii DTO 134E9 TaxID=1073089 RepID=A0A1L9R9M1_ASPWE|nr:uncharacterized protein ASPWEDRAFT_697843 [Aspergillus wentii DTO 134E9]OJJ31612.1 hypothetical protein ASPWEDRAFT_697843 [Aspergillus wentii DTO 134E9]
MSDRHHARLDPIQEEEPEAIPVPAACEPVAQTNPPESPMRRLSQWLWPWWTATESEVHETLVDRASNVKPDCNITASKTTSGSKIQQTSSRSRSTSARRTEAESSSRNDKIPEEESIPCKACRIGGAVCDRQRPRCSHCLDQQILCFYVEPLRLTMARNKKARATITQAQITPSQLQQSHCQC